MKVMSSCTGGELRLLNYLKVRTLYEDREKRDVCGDCGSYYVVSPEQLEHDKGIVKDMYEALKGIVADLENIVQPSILEATLEALKKAEGK